MLITILAAGTRGDTQPYIALVIELKKAGHSVRITAFEKEEAFWAQRSRAKMEHRQPLKL